MSELWKHGPTWLLENDLSDRVGYSSSTPDDTANNSFNALTLTVTQAIPDFVVNFSSYNKCINTVAYILHILQRSKPTSLVLSVWERHTAFVKLIIWEQNSFQRERRALLTKQQVPKGSPLESLNVYLDDAGIIRVGGRLSASNVLSLDFKHPIVLNWKSRLLELYIRYVHCNHYHTSKSFVVNFVRAKFWIVGGINRLVKKIIFECVQCTRFKAETAQQLMGDLPIERIKVCLRFTHIGVH